MIYKCDGVFEGGGVKGIGFAGAVAALEEQGYQFENVVGTSAGAIAAALVAAGYSGAEMEKELMSVNLMNLRQSTGLSGLGGPGQLVNLFSRYGVYRADYFEKWIGGLLEKKGKRVFGDMRTRYKDEKYAYKFQAVASDISENKILILPRDLKRFGIDPDKFEIAKAVRMSMSIPFFYEPFRLIDTSKKEHLIVDGGLLSNYPIWILDDGTENPPWPTFGFKFISCFGENCDRNKTNNFIAYSKAMVSTLLEAGDNYRMSLSKGDEERSIMIPALINTKNGQKIIKTTYFEIRPEESAALFENGRQAALDFLTSWDFCKWKKKYRQKKT